MKIRSTIIDHRSPKPVVILGPTASGKSAFAVALAEALPERAQIISADSMQIYRGLDVGTAKPDADLRQRVTHHLIDIVDPSERFTVADWLERAEALIASLQAAGTRLIVVGGTNLYIKVLLEGMFDAPPADPALRAQLEAVDVHELHERLRAIDPGAADRIHRNDRKRIIRALEVHAQTGRPISAQQTQWGADAADDAGPRYRHNPILIGLDWPTPALNRRINARVNAMFYPRELGLDHPSLPEEVEALESANRLGPQARKALGYKQVLEHRSGRCTLEEAFEQTRIQTRRYAKQQRTWLKRYRNVHWLEAEGRTAGELAALARCVMWGAETKRRRDEET